MSKRARISDNDPLSQTDSVLDSFAQYGKSGRQQANKSRSQDVNQSESAEPDFPDLSDTMEPEPVEFTPPPAKSTRRKASKPTGQQANKSRSQEVDKPALKKATFQLSEAVLQQLDTFHLQLQLELGKANAPYKEVMVEESILMLLERAGQNRAKVLNALHSRQQQRE